MKNVAVIMAGGRGERFWPKSRRALPKQFLSLANDGTTMIQNTVKRILPLVDVKDIFIATNKMYVDLVKEQLPDIPVENILCEPVGKNTAPCIGLAAIHIRKRYRDATMIVLPSDHLIKYNSMFADVLIDACTVAQTDHNLVTIGIMPTYPETGYGYIRFAERNKEAGPYSAYPVDCFVEKPNLELAKKYLADGNYLWNSGMFIWKASSILYNFEKFLPNISHGLCEIEESIGTPKEETVTIKEFNEFEKISIDYGILEKASDIYVMPGMFGWDDVGSWLAMERINQTNDLGNVVFGNVITVSTNNCIIDADKKLVAIVGLKDTIVVDTSDATLICSKDSTQNIPKVLENLKICNRNEYI